MSDVVMRCDFEQGTVVPEHEHPEEQMTIVLTGRLRMTAGERTFEAAAGEVVKVPAGVPHGAEALEPTVSIDVFTPVRPQLHPEPA